RIDVGVVRAVARVELGHAPDRRLAVAFARAGIPPAADLGRLRRVAHVDDAVELVVLRVARLEVRRAGSHVDRLAVDEPQAVRATRVRPGGVEVHDRARLLGLAYVEQLEPRRLHADLLGLVGNGQDVARDLERVGAHL